LPEVGADGADADAVIDAFGKNVQVCKVFWTLFVVMAGIVPARVVGPGTVQNAGGDYYGEGDTRPVF